MSEQSLLDFFKTTIRYFASGFIFIILLSYLMQDSSIWSFTTDNLNLTIVLVALICGIIIYGIHLAILDDLFNMLSLKMIADGKDYETFIGEELKPYKKNRSSLLFHFTIARYRRLGIKNPVSKSIQIQFEQFYAILSFLYTSSYTLIVLPVVFTIKNLLTSKTGTEFDIHYLFIILGGLALAFSGFMLDLKVTKRELFYIKNKITQ